MTRKFTDGDKSILLENKSIQGFFCPDCGYQHHQSEPNIRYCRNCGLKFDIRVNKIGKLPKSFMKRKTSNTIIEFFKDVKDVIKKITKTKLNYRQISVIYFEKKNKWYINDKILRAKGDPDWKLSMRIINNFEWFLSKNLSKEYKKVEPLLERYRVQINYQNYKKRYSEFSIKYFQEINSKVKFYWYDWLLAEGHFSEKGLRIEINPKDGILLKNFVRDLKINPE